MATVEMSFTPLPAHVRTARLVATAVARRSGVDEALLDEVRLAVGEACSRAVEAHQEHCPGEPVQVALTGAGGQQGQPGGTGPAGPLPVVPSELGLAVIEGLADDVEIARTKAGVIIRMSWPSADPDLAPPGERA